MYDSLCVFHQRKKNIIVFFSRMFCFSCYLFWSGMRDTHWYVVTVLLSRFYDSAEISLWEKSLCASCVCVAYKWFVICLSTDSREYERIGDNAFLCCGPVFAHIRERTPFLILRLPFSCDIPMRSDRGLLILLAFASDVISCLGFMSRCSLKKND